MSDVKCHMPKGEDVRCQVSNVGRRRCRMPGIGYWNDNMSDIRRHMLETEDIQYTRLRMTGVKCCKEKISDVRYHVGIYVSCLIGLCIADMFIFSIG